MLSETLVAAPEKHENIIKSRTSPWFLYISAITANLLIFSAGLIFMWTSPVIPNLLSNNPEVNPLKAPVTTTQISILAALPPICATVGLLSIAPLTNLIGRKKSMFCFALGILVAFNIMAFSKHIYIYYLCLAVIGFCNGGTFINVPLFITEIAEDSNRGKLGCLTTLSIPCASLYGYVIGSVTDVPIFLSLCSLPALLHVLLSTLVLHESPAFLIYKRKKDRALKTLGKLRIDNSYNKLEQEYEKIIEYLKEDGKVRKYGVLDLFRDRGSRKAFLLSLVIFSSQQTCGNPVIAAFVAPIFNEINSNLSGNMVGIIIGACNVIIYLLAAFSVDRFGRRRLMKISTSICSIMMLLLGIYFYLEKHQSGFVSTIRWLPILFVIGFIAAYGVGMGPLPLLLVSELLPYDLRAKGIATISVGETVVAFLVMFSYPLIDEHLGKYCAMWIFSFFAFVSFNVIYFLLPETKCKNFAEIQKLLNE